MNVVTLQFNNEKDLRRFCSTIKHPNLEISSTALTVTCHCDEEEIELAITVYGATLLST